MAFAFNPITGKLDLVGSGGGSATTDASLLTSGTLDDARLSSNVALDNIDNSFSVGQTIASGTLTSSSPALALTQTWNASGQTFSAMTVNVTDTASAAGSRLIDFQKSGVSVFNIDKNGGINGQNDINAQPLYLRSRFGNNKPIVLGDLSGGNLAAHISFYGFCVSNGAIALGVGSAGSAGDVVLNRDAANTLAQRNGTNAQTFRVYNTFTDASNYERGFMRWNANTLEIGTEAGGTGTARSLRLFVGSVSSLFSASGSGLRANFRDAVVGFGLYGSGSSSSNVLLKQSGTSWIVRNGTDNAFGEIQGKLTTDTAYTATPITPTGYVTIYDSTGTAYKVACSL